MRSKNPKEIRPLTDREKELDSDQKSTGESNLKGIVEKISLESVSLEERQKEAKKPLYLLRYE
jgi:hypothetical protein